MGLPAAFSNHSYVSEVEKKRFLSIPVTTGAAPTDSLREVKIAETPKAARKLRRTLGAAKSASAHIHAVAVRKRSGTFVKTQQNIRFQSFRPMKSSTPSIRHP
jgi:hypothetical protein